MVPVRSSYRAAQAVSPDKLELTEKPLFDPPEFKEEEHEDLAEPDVVGLHEVARPRDVIPQEGRPALPVAAGPRATHVSLDGSLADADAELEQLAAEALRAPARHCWWPSLG